MAELDRLDLVAVPGWMESGDLLAALREVRGEVMQPGLGNVPGQLGLLDTEGIRRLQEELDALPWVKEARVLRRFPDRIAVQLQVRRPVLTLVDAVGERWVLDRSARCLPARHGMGLELPKVRLRGGWDGQPVGGAVGRIHPDPRARAAVAVAREWHELLVPALRARGHDAPDLLEVDPYNLGGRMLHPLYHPEIRVLVARRDGEMVSLAYGRSPGSETSRVPVEVKADVLVRLLREFPGLAGCTGADLRYANRWRDYVLPPLGEDPFGRDEVAAAPPRPIGG